MSSFAVPEMSCGHCKAAIERAVSAADPAARVRVDLSTRTVSIDSLLDPAVLMSAIETAGYAAQATD